MAPHTASAVAFALTAASLAMAYVPASSAGSEPSGQHLAPPPDSDLASPLEAR